MENSPKQVAYKNSWFPNSSGHCGASIPWSTFWEMLPCKWQWIMTRTQLYSWQHLYPWMVRSTIQLEASRFDSTFIYPRFYNKCNNNQPKPLTLKVISISWDFLVTQKAPHPKRPGSSLRYRYTLWYQAMLRELFFFLFLYLSLSFSS